MEQHQPSAPTPHTPQGESSAWSTDEQEAPVPSPLAQMAVGAMEHPAPSPASETPASETPASESAAPTVDSEEASESDTLVAIPAVRLDVRDEQHETASRQATVGSAGAADGGAGMPTSDAAQQGAPLAGWQAGQSTSLVFSPRTAAGVSYLFWWLSGLIVYFNERENRFVRFHAVQSILLTSALTVLGVATLLTHDLLVDLTYMTGVPIYQTLGQWEAVLGWLLIVFVWLGAMVAAWSGHYFRLPYLGRFADRYSAPFPMGG